MGTEVGRAVYSIASGRGLGLASGAESAAETKAATRTMDKRMLNCRRCE